MSSGYQKAYIIAFFSFFMEQEVKLDTAKIMERLGNVQKDLDYIREYLEDITLTKEDVSAIKDANAEYKAGNTTSLEDLKKEFSE